MMLKTFELSLAGSNRRSCGGEEPGRGRAIGENQFPEPQMDFH